MPAVVVWSVTAVGAALVVVAVDDIFRTIWYPSGRGRLSRVVMTAVWRARRRGSSGGTLVGPLAMVAVVLAWVVLLTAGWALVYWPRVDGGFSYSSGLVPAARSDLLDAVYISSVALVTLGFGDVVPTTGWLRVALPLEALLGFAVLTAAVSWGLQVYPALTRRRALAVRLSLLRQPDGPGLTHDAPLLAVVVLDQLATALAQARVDLTQYAETYYFRERDPEASMAAVVGVALHLAEDAGRSPDPAVHGAGRLLAAAAGDYLHVVDEQFLHVSGSSREVAAAYAADHGHPQAAEE